MPEAHLRLRHLTYYINERLIYCNLTHWVHRQSASCQDFTARLKFFFA